MAPHTDPDTRVCGIQPDANLSGLLASGIPIWNPFSHLHPPPDLALRNTLCHTHPPSPGPVHLSSPPNTPRILSAQSESSTPRPPQNPRAERTPPPASSPGHSGTRLAAPLPRRSAPRASGSLHLSGLALLSIESDAKQLLSEYLLNPMEQRLGTHTAPRGAPPARKEAGRAQGGACRLSSEVSETACSLRRPSERRKPMTTSGVVQGPVTGARTPRRPWGRPTAAAAPGSQQGRLPVAPACSQVAGQRVPAGPSSLREGCLGLSTGRTGEVSQC